MTRDHHYHACTCGEVWDHMTPPDDASDAEYDAAHECRQCGKTCRTKYTAEEAAEVKGTKLANQRRPPPPEIIIAALLQELLSR